MTPAAIALLDDVIAASCAGVFATFDPAPFATAETIAEVDAFLEGYLAARRARVALPGCTGLTARWCPVHGDCACEGDDLDDARCPLHAPASAHADEPGVAAIGATS